MKNCKVVRIPVALSVWVLQRVEPEQLCYPLLTKAWGRQGLKEEAMLDDNLVVRSSSVWPSVIVFVLCLSVFLLS